ncbi:MAG: 4Fe-4S binding protein, partial [Candidatus Aminicenantes bacterium]|nr:4Fe-4S binding protein [Candidatus Aminicenantes bacterium]
MKRRDFIRWIPAGGLAISGCVKPGSITRFHIDPRVCTGCGDCVSACTFDAVYLARPPRFEVIAERCTGCG